MSSRILLEGMDVEHFSGFINLEKSIELFSSLKEEIPWNRPKIRTPAGLKSVPRLVAWIADPGVTYSYSGITQSPIPWTPAVLEIKTLLEQFLKAQFNGCLGNYYQDRNDSIGKHADDEEDLIDKSIIASVSFGGTREFRMRHMRLKKLFKFSLKSGDLIVMRDDTQKVCFHWIEKEDYFCEERINLTFRQMKSS